MNARDLIASGPLLIAHRGGSGLAPENTLAAFEAAQRDWAADMIELDVRATADGVCVVFHDPTIERTTDGTGAVSEMRFAELRAFDAGYRFTPDGGISFPFRGKGVRIPTLAEVLERLPAMPLTVEVKAGSAQAPLFETIRQHEAVDRVIAAGMYDADRTQFRDFGGPISASTEQFTAFYRFHMVRLGRFRPPPSDVVQIPEIHEGRRIVTRRLVGDLAANNIPVHVWTVDQVDDMQRLLDWGIRGIITDRPDRLARVLHERTGRPLPTGARHAGESSDGD